MPSHTAANRHIVPLSANQMYLWHQSISQGSTAEASMVELGLGCQILSTKVLRLFLSFYT